MSGTATDRVKVQVVGPFDRLASAARDAVQHVKGRRSTDEPDYMDALASALGQYEQAARYRADLEKRLLDAGLALVDLHDEEGEPKDGSLERRLDIACAVCELAESIAELSTLNGIEAPAGTTAEFVQIDASTLLETYDAGAMLDAFAAGAEYMRRSARVAHTPHVPRAAGARVILPDAGQVQAAGVGFLEAFE